MAINLQVENAVSSTAQSVKDQNGNPSSLTLSTDKVGIGTTNPKGKLEVVGDWDEEGALRLTGDKPTIRFSGGANSGNQQWLIHEGGNGPGDLEFYNGGTTGAWSLVMSLTPDGNVKVAGGVVGESMLGEGVRGVSHSAHGAVVGVNDWSPSAPPGAGGNGGWFESAQGEGVRGWSKTPHHGGVVGVNTAGGVGVYGEGRVAGFFNGDVEVTGDIRLINADCAEDFEICETEQIEPGTVMVLGDEGILYPSQQAYDKRVAGVVSGAGDYKPGIVLDKQQSSSTRKPIALLGKVYCKVDAQYGVIEVGDLLTTSPTPGHAMKADDPLKAFGTVIGKALRPLAEGQGLIPILIALQ